MSMLKKEIEEIFNKDKYELGDFFNALNIYISLVNTASKITADKLNIIYHDAIVDEYHKYNKDDIRAKSLKTINKSDYEYIIEEIKDGEAILLYRTPPNKEKKINVLVTTISYLIDKYGAIAEKNRISFLTVFKDMITAIIEQYISYYPNEINKQIYIAYCYAIYSRLELIQTKCEA